MIELGSEVKCKVSGFKGVAVAKYEFLSGCLRYSVQPKVGKDGKLPEPQVFDEPQLEITKKAKATTTKPKPKKKKGGPPPYLPIDKPLPSR